MKSGLRKTGARKHSLAGLIRESVIFNIISIIADFLYDGVKNSFFASLFPGYSKLEEKFENSIVGGFLGKLFANTKKVRDRKLRFAKACENSVIIGGVGKRNRAMLSKPGRYYGSGLMYFGVYTAVVHVAKYLLIREVEYDSSYIYIGLWALLSGLVLVACKDSMGSLISKSKLLSVVFRLFDIDTRHIDVPSSGAVSQGSAIAVGTLFGLLTFFVHPLLIALVFVAVFGVMQILHSPEFGLIVIFLLLPFFPTMLLAGLVILTALSYFFKVLRGKRVFRLNLFDLTVAAFALIVFFSGLISAGGMGSLPPALMFVCFMSAYFLVVNLVRSEELLIKCVSRMMLASVFVALYGIYQNFFGTTTAAWLDSGMFSEIGNRVVSTFENPNVLGQYLILLLPFCIMAFVGKDKTKNERIFGAVSCALVGLCLIFTWSRGAWLGAIFGVAVMMLIFSRHTMKVVVAGMCCIPVLPFVIPSTVLGRFTSIGNLADSSTQYRVNIWKGTFRMLSDYIVGGIGMGESAYRSIYPYYSLEAIEKAPHSHNLYLQVWVEAGIFAMIFLILLFALYIKLCADFVTDKNMSGNCSEICLAGFAGIIAVLLQGFTDYIWYNYRFFLIFWLVIALCVAARKIKTDEQRVKAQEQMM